jgi:hypothetical protein
MTKLRRSEGAHSTSFKGVSDYEDVIFKRITLDEYLKRGADADEEVRSIGEPSDADAIHSGASEDSRAGQIA